MTPFIVHAKGFVLETTALLLRDRGVPVVETDCAEEAIGLLALVPDAVFVCGAVPPLGSWTHDRRVILLDGVDDADALELVADGAQVVRPADGRVEAMLEVALADESVLDAEVLELQAVRPLERPVLTPRQLDVVHLIARGHTSHEIADRLGVRPKTVENYKQRVFVRLGVQNQAHAVARCARLGLMDDDHLSWLAS